jgi:hypothetical protein
MSHFLWLIPVGFLVGLFGTVVGAGGGFILMPLLLILYPVDPPQVLTNISLCIVCLNALSGSLSYARMKRIHYRAGIVFIVAGIPGAALGAIATYSISRWVLDVGCGALLLASGVYLLWRSNRAKEGSEPAELEAASHECTRAHLTTGALMSSCIGFLSSILGIGGGIIHVPMLVHLLEFPVHLATATSHFVLAGMSFTAVFVHILSGAFNEGVRRTAFLGVGVIVGAQLGARASSRLHGDWIMRGLASALCLLGARLLWQAI